MSIDVILELLVQVFWQLVWGDNLGTYKLLHHYRAKTRKPSYRKDDRAMRPMYGCPENVCDTLTMPMVLSPKFQWLLCPYSL